MAITPMFSSLYRLRADAEHAGVVVGTMPDGSVVVHGPPGEPIPPEVLQIYRLGFTPWFWRDLPALAPELVPHVAPQEYAGEPTGEAIDVAVFPRLAPALEEGV